jgi:predicted nucleotidyltransferase
LGPDEEGDRVAARTADVEQARSVARALAAQWGARLHRVMLFGSRARGAALDDSDLDC